VRQCALTLGILGKEAALEELVEEGEKGFANLKIG